MNSSDTWDAKCGLDLPPRIVIVEDENIVALDIKMHLKKFGFQVVGIFASGEETLEQLEVLKPDLILMDIKLQGKLDGLETSRLVTERYSIPVILLTAFADEATLQRAKIVEPFGYIIKPFDERELRTAIVIGLYRHAMQRKLRQREELFSTILQSITDGVIVLDPLERIDYMNSLAESMIEQSLTHVQGKLFREIFHLRPSEIKIHALRYGSINELNTPGKTRQVEMTTSPLVNERGEKAGTVIVLHDVTEQITVETALYNSEVQLRQAQKMEAIGRLAGGIAHDFNNFLTIILGYVRLLLDDSSIGTNIRTNIEGIQQAALRSVNLTRQLLTFSRNQVAESKICNLNTLVRDMEKMIRRLVSEEVNVIVSVDANPSEVYVDPGQIEQAIVNLVINAKDAINGPGSIYIQTSNMEIEPGFTTVTGPLNGGQYVSLTVRDTGHGIPDHLLPNIFEPFFSTKESGKGTGLGLSLVYGIVKQCEGGILVQSTPEEGSTFTLLFPLQSTTITVKKNREDTGKDLRGTETVLVVEDEEYIRSLITKYLSRYGYHIVEAPNAGEAFLICEETQDPIDLIVTDVILPHINGRKLYERLKGIIPSLKVLFISGYPQKILLEKGLLTPEATFLQKPFDFDVFLQKVRKILDS